MSEQIKIEEITALIVYNEYIELPKDLKNIGEELQRLNLTSNYRISAPTTPFVISGLIPLATMEFVEGSEKPKYLLSLDQKTLRFSRKFSPSIELSKESIEKLENLMNEFKEAFSKVWNSFNSIANRSIIERVGFITLFDIGNFSVFNLLKTNPNYEFGSFRFFEIIKENISPFVNTKIIPNAIIDPNIDTKNDRLKTYKLISDIATVPNSKGIIPPNSMDLALSRMIKISIQNIQKIWRVLESA